MKKHVGIARATICNAPVLIYDEPTARLDPVTTSKIYDLLTDLRRTRHASTVIAISSDIPALRQFVDHILFLHQGRVLYCGPRPTWRPARTRSCTSSSAGSGRAPSDGRRALFDIAELIIIC
jgi:phospholipid/cholesterol/gamma-HCH transport system ATP-binding protein